MQGLWSMVTKRGGSMRENIIKWLVFKYMPRYRLVSRDLLNEYARQWRKKRNEKKETNQGE
jgi:hypothetical protein